jgi:DNA-binding MarR family transcriptional regulator
MAKDYRQQIVIRRLERPLEENFEKEVEWLCQCLGLSSEEEKLPVDIFKTLLTHSQKGRPVSSTMLTKGKNVTRGAIVYHLNRFIQSGLVVRRGREYTLRDRTLTRTLDEVEEDVLRFLRRMKEIAEKIDEAVCEK